MASELLDIQPRELKFLFELKKQSSCTIRLVNKFNDYVAFKIKTTSPKKYCVRPNIGVIKPKSFCDFTVTMQAPKVAPPDLVCKDKFLVQSTVVPVGTSDDDITSSIFARDDDKLVEEVKLRVVLLSPPNSPILSPINKILKQDPVYEAPLMKYHVSGDLMETKMNNSEVVKPVNSFKYNTEKQAEDLADHAEHESMKELEDQSSFEVYKSVKRSEGPVKNGDYKTQDHLKHEVDVIKNGDNITLDDLKDEEDPEKHVDYETLNHLKDAVNHTKDAEYETLNRMKRTEQSLKDINKTMEDVKEPTEVAEYRKINDVEVPVKDVHHNTVKNMDEMKFVKDVEEMKSKLKVLESKLIEAEMTISKLTERRWTGQERESLRKESDLLRSKGGDRKVQVGFPLLFVCMVALVSVVLGYTLRC